MSNTVQGKTMFDLVDAMDMNNDCLSLLMDSLAHNETRLPDGLQTLLNSVFATYGEIGKNLRSLLKH